MTNKLLVTPHQDQSDTNIVHIDSIQEVILREQYRSLTRMVPYIYGVVLLSTLILTSSTFNSAPLLFTVLLPSAMLCIVVPRLGYWIKARKHCANQDLNVIRRDIFAIKILGPGLSLGFTLIGGAALYYGDQYQQSLVLVTIWITAVTSAFCLFTLPRAAVLVVLSCSIPLSAEFLIQGNIMMALLAFLLLIISSLVIYMLRENYRAFSEIIQSRTRIAEEHRLAEEAKEAATVIANTDYLTKLPNRRHFKAMLAAKVRAGPHSENPFAVGIMDLDGFKPINDIHGHSVGDQMLQQVAARLASVMNGRGHLARMGGDEFAAICEGIGTAPEAIVLGKKLQAIFAEPFIVGSIAVRLSCTCGFSFFPSSCGEPNRLIDCADMALYKVKATERGGIGVFDTHDEEVALERAKIEQALRRALSEEALDVHFQPIIDLTTGQIYGFESLARWHDPKLGDVSPVIFIPIAEQIGVMESLTSSLLRKAATVAAGWPNHLMLCFNLSAEDLSKPSSGLKIISILSECGLSPQRFEVEITETAVMKDIESSYRTIGTLRAAGIQVALDDFGTGYSGLSQIRDLALDKIKIDKSFVDRFGVDERITKLVHSVIDMCQRLELPCIAEGVERYDQFDELKQAGCFGGQGYFFSCGLPEEKVIEYIQRFTRRAA